MSCGHKIATVVHKAQKYGQYMYVIYGTFFLQADLNQNFSSFMHMFNTCVNCVACFKFLLNTVGGIVEKELYYKMWRMEGHTDMGKTIFPSPHFVAGA